MSNSRTHTSIDSKLSFRRDSSAIRRTEAGANYQAISQCSANDSPSRKARLSFEDIQLRLGYLMRAYLRRRSNVLAAAVAKYISTLLAHPEFDAHPDQRCVFRRLEREWRYLSCCDTSMPSDRRQATGLNRKIASSVGHSAQLHKTIANLVQA